MMDENNTAEIINEIKDIALQEEVDDVKVTLEPGDDVVVEPVIEIAGIEEIEQVEIDVSEAVGWVSGDTRLHTSLAGRDESNQHPISAISGLRAELDEIQALKSVHSNHTGAADYYEWGHDAPDGAGYFVGLAPNSSTIKICEDGNIFGVTVDTAGFVGNQTEPVRGNSYGLVATTGMVNVRCASNVEVGDYVVSNTHGVAEKTTSNYGYKVIAINEKLGTLYAQIMLGVQACVTDAMGKELQRLSRELDDAEINISSAANTALEAYNKAVNSDSVSEAAILKALEAIQKAEGAIDSTGSMNDQLGAISVSVAQARAISESAATSAESIRKEAVETANKALDDVNTFIKELDPITTWTYVDPATGETSKGAEYFAAYVENGVATKTEISTVDTIAKESFRLAEESATSVSSMISSVDKYSVGPYSQAYGLTIAQARNILKPNTIYIPTSHSDGGTHKESYEGSVDREFTNGFYYEWIDNGDGFGWSESIGRVWFGESQPVGNMFDYWYDGATLFVLQNEQWIKVATLAGNVNNRITSMIRQDVDEVRTEIVNAYGSVAGFGAKLSETESKVNSVASWPTEDGNHMLATIEQVADGDSSHLVLAAVTTDGTKTLDGATIVLNNDSGNSSIYLDADYITFNGTTTFLKSSDLGANGSTEIDGSRITTGQISADRIDVSGIITAVEAEIGEVVADTITADYLNTSVLSTGELIINDEDGDKLFSAGNNTVYLAGWKVDSNSLYHGSSFTSSDMFICTGSGSSFKIGGSGSINGWMIRAGNNFGVTKTGAVYANDVHLTGEITATSGYIGNKDTGWSVGSSGIICMRKSPLNANDTVSSGLLQIDNYTVDTLRSDYSGKSPIRIFAGAEEVGGGFTHPHMAPFVVLDDGSVYCSALASIGYRLTDGNTYAEVSRVTLQDGIVNIKHGEGGAITIPLIKFLGADGWMTVSAVRESGAWKLSIA